MKTKLIFLVLWFVVGCSSTKLVGTWKNPDIVLFDAYQVLVVGMSQDEEVQTEFETRMTERLKAAGVDAMRSIDLFDVEFTSSQKSEQELSEVEQQLLDKGFDAILFTKVVGTENKRTFRERMNNFSNLYTRFSSDYLGHQDIYYDPEYYETFNLYHIETALYCICVDKERELIWKGDFEVEEPSKVDKTIDAYIKLMTSAMQEEDVIF
ncbi:hypothetical protein [Flagellimonas flava]|uniref:Cardiolipin synthetase n=1 Tax=Flagellimonas flava TaxID=570519 RepID=A0A1M5LTJ7_9FLAO|nr:hypothetical protein [Allomuricauda flava]SHG67959.1 hypothetical protein SAMN04488116_2065 [Allomuricauda flava]